MTGTTNQLKGSLHKKSQKVDVGDDSLSKIENSIGYKGNCKKGFVQWKG